MDDDENARYLAAYIMSYQDDVLHYSYDRNGSHSTGKYEVCFGLDQDALERVITAYYANLL